MATMIELTANKRRTPLLFFPLSIYVMCPPHYNNNSNNNKKEEEKRTLKNYDFFF